MKRNSLINRAIIGLIMIFGIMSGELHAQEGEYTVNIKQPAQDTIYRCLGENIIFIGEGFNTDGSAFDNNQVTYTWELGEPGITETGSTIAYPFEAGGHYLVKLFVTSLNGNPAQNSPEVHVFIGMTPSFSGTRSDQSSICSGEEITLTGFVAANPWTGDEYEFENTYDQSGFEWSGPIIVSDRNGIAKAQPPLDEGNQNYIFRVEDDFGCFHDTILTLNGLYAEYSFNPTSGEAPLEVEFTPEEVDNGGFNSEVSYLWEAYEENDPTMVLSSTENIFVFERPGEYVTWMTASYDQCTYRFEETDMFVKVDSSLLEIPNVFTPNDDGLNDYFQVKSLSLKSFNGRIFNRWGKIVYEWSDWKSLESGWNGNHQGTGSESPSGTYYYVIEARGWDWDYDQEDYKQYKDKIYTGFVTLLR